MAITLKQDLEAVDCSSIMNEIHQRLGLKTKAAQEFLRIALANTLLMDRKQLDYGPGNIAGYGTFGCVVRMNDKFERIKHLYMSGRRKRAINESLLDSFRDVGNYAIIALQLELNRWPNE